LGGQWTDKLFTAKPLLGGSTSVNKLGQDLREVHIQGKTVNLQKLPF
jgi:hypothetical protein